MYRDHSHVSNVSDATSETWPCLGTLQKGISTSGFSTKRLSSGFVKYSTGSHLLFIHGYDMIGEYDTYSMRV